MIPVPFVLPTCGEVYEHLSEWIDGELTDRVAARVQLHVRTCPGCGRLAAELAATVMALHRLGRHPRQQFPQR
jgi:anti-sigma factor RsiW